MIYYCFLAASSRSGTIGVVWGWIAAIVYIFYVLKYSLFAYWLITGQLNSNSSKRKRYTKEEKDNYKVLFTVFHPLRLISNKDHKR